MTEQLISFKTAKLAKDKGFNEFSFSVYDNTGNLVTDYSEYSPNMRYYNDKMNPSKENPNWWLSKGCTAPTQSLLQKWLRETHKIDINIFYDAITYDVDLVHPTIQIKGNDNYYTKLNRGTLSENTCTLKYEEALEKGLQEALKLI